MQPHRRSAADKTGGIFIKQDPGVSRDLELPTGFFPTTTYNISLDSQPQFVFFDFCEDVKIVQNS